VFRKDFVALAKNTDLRRLGVSAMPVPTGIRRRPMPGTPVQPTENRARRQEACALPHTIHLHIHKAFFALQRITQQGCRGSASRGG
jgi:hypothetical protein